LSSTKFAPAVLPTFWIEVIPDTLVKSRVELPVTLKTNVSTLVILRAYTPDTLAVHVSASAVELSVIESVEFKVDAVVASKLLSPLPLEIVFTPVVGV
jgi:hypothetical protein